MAVKPLLLLYSDLWVVYLIIHSDGVLFGLRHGKKAR